MFFTVSLTKIKSGIGLFFIVLGVELHIELYPRGNYKRCKNDSNRATSLDILNCG